VGPAVLSLLVVIVILCVVLTATLWFATLFLQSYFYTEPSGGIFWKAPLAAGVLTFFYLCWSLLNVLGGSVVDGRPEIPYGVIWEFSNRTYMMAEPVAQIESKPKTDTEPRIYLRDKVAGPYAYKRKDGTERWSPEGVEWVKLTHDGKAYKFVAEKREGRYKVFVDDASGWELREIEMGKPTTTSFWRLVMYFFLNVTHLVLWVACIWLVLRFALSHAIGLGVVTWLVFTLAVFPGLFGRSAAALI
jgi:hypothetical protein